MVSWSYLSKNMNRFFNNSIFVVLVVSSVFAFVHRIFAGEMGLNYFEYLVEIFTSQKMFVYVIILFYIFAITRIVTEVSNQELMRFGSFFRYALNFFVSVVAVVVTYVLILLSLYALVGIGLPIENVFDNAIVYLPDWSQLSASPVVILCVSLFHLTLFLVTMTMVMKVIFTLFSYRAYLIAVLSGFILLMVSMGSPAFHWIAELDGYITSFNACYYLQNQFYYYYIVEIAVIVLCFVLLKYKWNRKSSVRK